MKKFLTVALLTLYAMSAQSRESITIGDYLFTYSPAESNAWARNYVGNDSHAVVPSSISFMTEMRDSHGYVIYDDDGKPRKIFHHYDVTEAISTFIRKNVTEVILPNSIKRLWSTFTECHSLTSVDLGSVEIIDSSTFWECTSLASIEIPSTVKIIGDNAFNSCSSLSSIIIPSSVTNIGYDAFIDCDALTSIETPSSLKFLGSGSFRYCASLKSAEINGTNLAVGGGTFQECPNLETAILGPGIVSIADGSTTSGYEWGMFAYCTSLKSVAINTTSVMKLPIAMFYRSSVQTVSVAGGFAEIGRGAFYRCTSLETIDGFLAPITIGDEAFYKCSKFKGGVDFSRCEAISGWAFYECSSLTNVRFGPNLSSIGSNAFYGCSKLELVEFDGAPPSVGSGAFSRVKSGAVGTYIAEHAAEWDAVIDADGKWNGLIMKQLEPPAPPTLSAETADWTYGTITLRCEDANLNGAAVPFYNLMYYDTAEAKWRVIDRYDLTIPTPVEETNSSGGKTTVTRITDKYFSKRNNGVGTVKYRVVDEADSSRVAGCETRNRHGLFVAVNEYQNGWESLEGHYNHVDEANAFRSAYLSYGGANGYVSMTWSGPLANRDLILAELDSIATAKVTPGDIALFYYVGHGADGWLTCYDHNTYISASELSECLHKFPVGVGVVALIDSCHSAGMIDRTGIDDGMGNIAWIVAAQADQTTGCGAFRNVIGRGWIYGGADYYDPAGAAGGNGDGYVTFGELAIWAQQWTAKTYYRYRTLTDTWNSLVFRNIVAGVVPNHKPVTPLTDGPSTLTALPGNSGEIRLSWTAVRGASGYDIYRKLRSAMPSTYVYVDTVKGTSTRDGSSYALTPNVEYEYYVRAVNDVYVSDASPTASCAPSENMKILDYVSRFMSALSTSSINYSEHPPIVNGEVDYSNLNYDHDGDGMTTFEEYVAGTNPADNADRFVAFIKIEDGGPSISWLPNLNTNGSERIYTVWGKTNLFDEVGWTSPTNSGHRFFKVTVDMP